MAEITVSVIVACAGSSTRMEGINKQLVELDGIPVAVRSMLAFEGLDEVTEIIVSARESDIPEIERLAKKHGVTKFKCAIAGGVSRTLRFSAVQLLVYLSRTRLKLLMAG